MILDALKKYKIFFLSGLFFLLLLVLLFFSVKLTQETQLTDSQASTDQGIITVDTQSSRFPLLVGQQSAITFRVDTHGAQTYGVQIVVDVTSSALSLSELSAMRITSKNSNQLELMNQRMDSIPGGVRFWFTARPTQIASAFSSTHPIEFAEIMFTPRQKGNIVLTFQNGYSHSTIFNEPTNDQLKSIPQMNYAIEDPGVATQPGLPRSGNGPSLLLFIVGVFLVTLFLISPTCTKYFF